MIALVQRVSQAHVVVDDAQVGSIGRGLLVFVCAQHGDDEAVADRLVSKLLGLRLGVFEVRRQLRRGELAPHQVNVIDRVPDPRHHAQIFGRHADDRIIRRARHRTKGCYEHADPLERTVQLDLVDTPDALRCLQPDVDALRL